MSGRDTSLTLLERLRNADDEVAWQIFHDLYKPIVYHWLMRRGVVHSDADDVMQEVMKQAVAELPKFRHNTRKGAFRAWLRQVVSNRLRTFWRQKNRHGAAGGSRYTALADELEDPNSELSQHWNQEYYRAVCDRLLAIVDNEFQPATMEAFRCVAIKGQKPAEVAEELRMSANAVRIAQSRVMRRLRELGDGVLD